MEVVQVNGVAAVAFQLPETQRYCVTARPRQAARRKSSFPPDLLPWPGPPATPTKVPLFGSGRPVPAQSTPYDCIKTMARGANSLLCLIYFGFWKPLQEFTLGAIQEAAKTSHVIYPTGKPRIPHLRRCQGLAVEYYSFTLAALDLRHPRLLQR